MTVPQSFPTLLPETPDSVFDASTLVARIAGGHQLNRNEALAVLSTPDSRTHALLSAAGLLRRRYFGNTVKVNYLVNLKSGLCPEDCTYCSQRLGSTSEILKYTWLKQDEAVHQAGLSPCSGLIVGMGETPEQLVEAVFALRELGAQSIPVNFLMPFDGTPLQGTWLLTPLACLRILALVRLACPDVELRMAGGREIHLRSQQAAALEVANSLFLGDYLTSEGQAAVQDHAMIADAGFVVLGQEGEDPYRLAEQLRRDAEALPLRQGAAAGCDSSCAASCSDASPGCRLPVEIPTPTLRRRGAGTGHQPNA